MKTIAPWALSLALAWTATASAANADPAVGKVVPKFTAELLDVSAPEPAKSELDSHATKRLTAYIVVGTRCPATHAIAGTLAEAEKKYRAKDVDFVYLYPNREDTLADVIAFHRKRNLGGRLVRDEGGALAKGFGARRTSEVFVANEDNVVVYHGAAESPRDRSIDPQPYLQMALDESLAGKPVTVATSQVFA